MRRAELVVIGGSWGGLDAVVHVLACLPASYPVPVALVLHRSPDAPADALASFLASRCALEVEEVDDKDELRPGTLHVSPADYHLLVDDHHLALSVDAPVRYSRPSIDVLFESAAEELGDGVVAVLLTGANDDGSRGLLRVKQCGGMTIAQDPATAARSEMPRSAVDAGAVDMVMSLEEIAAFLATLAAR